MHGLSVLMLVLLLLLLLGSFGTHMTGGIVESRITW